MSPTLILMFELTAPQAGNPQSELISLVKSELAFAQASAERGMRAAFLEFLADGALVFRPQPVDGRKSTRRPRRRPAN